jgi:hypothetical protein
MVTKELACDLAFKDWLGLAHVEDSIKNPG